MRPIPQRRFPTPASPGKHAMHTCLASRLTRVYSNFLLVSVLAFQILLVCTLCSEFDPGAFSLTNVFPERSSNLKEVMSVGPVISVPFGHAGAQETGAKQTQDDAGHQELNGGDLSDLGWLSQYKPFPTVPRSEETEAVAESVESSIQAQQRFALSQSCLPFNYNASDCNANVGNSAALGKPVCRWPKPAFSYSCLIAMALQKSETGQLPVHDIYDFMESNYPYFKTAPDGWKNSVRHNLSLNKWFVKVDAGDKSVKKKGCLWAINEIRRAAIEKEISKWSRKNPHAILAAMAKPGQDAPEVSISVGNETSCSTVSLGMPSNSNPLTSCSTVGVGLPQYSLQYPVPAAAASTASATGAHSKPAAAATTTTSSAAAIGNVSPMTGSTAVTLAPPMMAMSPFALPVLWPGYTLPVAGGVPVAGGMQLPQGIQMPGTVALPPGVPIGAGLQMPGTIAMTGAIQVPPGLMMQSAMQMPVQAPATAAPSLVNLDERPAIATSSIAAAPEIQTSTTSTT